MEGHLFTFRERVYRLTPMARRDLILEWQETFQIKDRNQFYRVIDAGRMSAYYFVWFCFKFGIKTLEEALTQPHHPELGLPDQLGPQDYLQEGRTHKRIYRMVKRKPRTRGGAGSGTPKGQAELIPA